MTAESLASIPHVVRIKLLLPTLIEGETCQPGSELSVPDQLARDLISVQAAKAVFEVEPAAPVESEQQTPAEGKADFSADAAEPIRPPQRK